MTENNKSSFQLTNAFFSSLHFRRVKQMPSTMEFPITIEIKTVEPGFPRIQLNLRVSSPEDAPLHFKVELVGLFDYVGEGKAYDKERHRKFISHTGFHMLWPYVNQIIRIVTGEMGMNPLNAVMPASPSIPWHEELEQIETKSEI